MNPAAGLLDLVGQGYRYAIDGQADWQELMLAATDHFDAQYAGIKTQIATDRNGVVRGQYSFASSEEAGFVESEILWDPDLPNPLVARTRAAPLGQVSVNWLMSDPALRDSDYFRAHIVMYDHCLSVMHHSPEEDTFIVMLRDPSLPAFNEKAIADFGLFARHLHDAATLARRANVSAQAQSEDSFDCMINPVMVLRADGRILRANTIARRMLDAGDLLHDREGRLSVTSQTPLNLLIRTALTGSAQTFRVLRSGAPPLNAVVSAAPDAWSCGVTDAVALVLGNPGNPPLPSETLLQDQFSLTQAEARFARRFVLSKSLPAAAEELGISRETARRHIKAVFEKTETHSQVELTHLLLLHPHAILSAMD